MNDMQADFKTVIGLGVAGNFTGHLEQAGEAGDFVDIAVDDIEAPKGLFPFYVPHMTEQFVGIYPLSSDTIRIPDSDANLQIEPEVALLCDIVYDNTKVSKLIPKKFGAYNDCSIRKPNAKKISEKKNWGADSKGVAETLIDIDDFSRGGVMDDYRIACYLYRNGHLEQYGVDSGVLEYGYFYERLLEWIIAKMNTQQDEGPLETIPELLKQAHYPKQALISIGATRYTAFGEKTYLKENDETYVVVYDASHHNAGDVEEMILTKEIALQGVSVLHQVVRR